MLRTFLGYLRRFLPWIFFGAASSAAGWQWGALAGLVASGVLLARERRHGVPAEALYIDFSTTAYFVLLTALSFADPGSGVKAFTGALPFVVQMLTAWASLLAHRPFTLGIARLRVPAQLAGSAEFISFNTKVTTAWAIGFTFGAIGAVLSVAEGPSTAAMLACQAVGVAGPGFYTFFQSRRMRARRPAQRQSSAKATFTV
jgi:hypothetical protein